uniref:Uncharacterized protein n=1 Tax=Anguilla anguilla TaxID=7936 RepID=A0A0E9R720_ANGAN
MVLLRFKPGDFYCSTQGLPILTRFPRGEDLRMRRSLRHFIPNTSFPQPKI